jgi:hypothetical protein
MSDGAPHEGGTDRRGFIVSGATAFAAGALAPVALGGRAGEDPPTTLLTGDFVGRDSSNAVEVTPTTTDRVVRVESTKAVGSFSPGDDVAVLLPSGAGVVDVKSVGAKGPIEARAVTQLVLGDRSDLDRVR